MSLYSEWQGICDQVQEQEPGVARKFWKEYFAAETENYKKILDGKVNLIFAETKGYLSANTREFCYWLHFIFNLKERVDIITDDDQFNINTILNADKQREALIKMAEDYIYLNPPDHQKWLNGVVSAITNLREDG